MGKFASLALWSTFVYFASEMCPRFRGSMLLIGLVFPRNVERFSWKSDDLVEKFHYVCLEVKGGFWYCLSVVIFDVLLLV